MPGLAGESAQYFRGIGYLVPRVDDAEHHNFEKTVIFYKENYLAVATAIAEVIPGLQNFERVEKLDDSSAGVRVVLGRDLVNRQFPVWYGGVQLSGIDLFQGDLPLLAARSSW
jgi:hypothetical protein